LDREDEQIVDFGCDESSNNRMELMACICVLKWIRENVPWDSVTRVQIFTDSQYVKDNLVRARGWKKNDWRNQHGEPRENADLWNQLMLAHAKTGITVHFEWTLGKKSEVLKRVDKAAKAAATRGGPGVDRGYKPGTIARSMVKGAATRFQASGQTAVIRPYRKNLLGDGEEKVRFDISSEDTRAMWNAAMRLRQPLSLLSCIASTDTEFCSMSATRPAELADFWWPSANRCASGSPK
jgi:ribonuclease HI